jgi:hypothetical protein
MTEEQRWPEPVYLTKDHAINMTLRDYFAAKAMQSMLPLFSDRPLKEIQEVPTKAYAMADAMIKARGQ